MGWCYDKRHFTISQLKVSLRHDFINMKNSQGTQGYERLNEMNMVFDVSLFHFYKSFQDQFYQNTWHDYFLGFSHEEWDIFR